MQILKALPVVLALLSSMIYSQSLTWQRAFWSPLGNDDEAYDICRVDDDNYYVAGLTSDPRAGYLIKLNRFGDTIWTRLVYYQEFIYAVVPMSDGGCILTGETGYLSRFNSSGDTLWNKRNNYFQYYNLTLTNDNNIIACGFDGWNNIAVVSKYDLNGNVIWSKTYNSISSYFKEIRVANDSGYVCYGRKDITGSPSANAITLVKISNSGSLLWNKQYILNRFHIPFGIELKTTGYILCGLSFDNVSRSVFLLSTDNIGDSLKITSFPVLINGWGGDILRANNNKYYVSYSVGGSSTLPTPSIIRAVDTNFNTIKQLTINPIKDYVEILKLDLATSSKDYILACGITNTRGLTDEDFYVARIDSALNLPPAISVIRLSNEIPDSYSLFQNFPNPFNPSTKIRMDIPSLVRRGAGVVVLKVYDILGREAATLVNEQLVPGTYEVDFDGSNLPSGIYFYRLQAGDYVETKKMILLK